MHLRIVDCEEFEFFISCHNIFVLRYIIQAFELYVWMFVSDGGFYCLSFTHRGKVGSIGGQAIQNQVYLFYQGQPN